MTDAVPHTGTHAAKTLTTTSGELLGLERPRRVASRLTFSLTDHSYVPKVDNPRGDWTATVALPALRRYAAAHGEDAVATFATIGTGSGTDILAAVEALDPARVLATDMHAEVARRAVEDARRNLLDAREVLDLPGYLGEPLKEYAGEVDLIWEDLPNIPVPAGVDLDEGLASSSFFDATRVETSERARRNLLALHCALLEQARGLLSDRGRVICCIGARLPLAEIRSTLESVGYSTRVLLYTWRIQTEAEAEISGYARQEAEGLGPFRFHALEDLERVFGRYSDEEAAAESEAIEAELAAHALTAGQALRRYEAGESLGHTVVAVEATPSRQGATG